MLFIPLFAVCQEKQGGLSVGLNFGKWTGDDDVFAHSLASEMNMQEGFSGFNFDSKSRTGFSMGFFYDFPINKSLSIQPEISYSQKGAKFSGNGRFNDYYNSYSVKSDVVMRLEYIDVVVLGKYSLVEGDVKPYFVAGLGFGYLISSQIKVSATVDGQSDSNSTKMDGFQKMDAHFDFGVGLDLFESIRLELRYALGLTSVSKEEDLKNGVISVNLGACF
jgi:outer membrane immunogenic protein